jgi:hypothetical protein
VQYFAALEPQRRLALHTQAAIRGAIPRALLKQIVAASYVQVWWPPFDQPIYTDRPPVWADGDYVDPDTGEALPPWQQALDQVDTGTPAHVVRFGQQTDLQGIIAPSADADRAIRYLTKYLTKTIAGSHTDDDMPPDPAYLKHVDRLHSELRLLPCSSFCANWLRYGIQPENAGPGLVPGECEKPAHDRANLGCGGRRVLASRQWSGKTLAAHKADRATVVRATLHAAGVLAPEVERMAATVTLPDGTPRFVWTDTRPDPHIYARVIFRCLVTRAIGTRRVEGALTRGNGWV